MTRKRGLVRVGGGLTTVALGLAAAAVAITMSQGPASAATGGTGTGYLSADGAHLVDSTGATVRLTGLNWFGMETDNKTFHGLWATVTWKSMMDHMAELGYNTIRVPYSDDALVEGAVATSVNTYTNPDLIGLAPMEILDKVVDYAGQLGMRILLDRHRPDSGSQSPLWYTSTVSESTWISNMQYLAKHYANNPTVIGIDLHNEPHADGSADNPTGACWGCGDESRDWRLAAQRAGNAVLQANSDWLIVVEGVSCPSGGPSNVWDNLPDEDCGWWGGNLSQAREYPVELSDQSKLVYSAHEYGVSVYHQTWFDEADFPENLPAIWDKYWGYLIEEEIAPVLIGEFGSTLADELDVQWLTRLMEYMGTGTSGMNFTYWSWNPNSGDTGGIVQDDWVTVNENKQSILQPYLIAPVANPAATTSAAGPTGATGTSATSGDVTCSAATKVDNTWSGGFQATVTVTNTGDSAVSPWTVTWNMPDDATIGSAWNATVTQSGAAVTAEAPAYSPSLASGASVSIGFTATSSGSGTDLSSIALNGATCG